MEGGDNRREASDEIDLRDTFFTLWKYRVVFLGTLIATVMLSAAFIAWIKAVPISRTALVDFQLEFQGAMKNEYPNGLRFDPGDLLVGSNLQAVYAKNQLQRYFQISEFIDALSVRRIDRAGYLERITSLEAQLGQNDISAADRRRIQGELDTILNNMRSFSFRLALHMPEKLPTELAYKILNDILQGWADDAVNRLNVLEYNIPVISREFVNEDLIQSEDYFVSLLILREKYEQLIQNIELIQNLPGGSTVRTDARRISLPELVLQLQDVIDHRIEPINGLIRSEGISKNIAMARIVLNNKISKLELDKAALQAKADIYAQSLKNYGGDALVQSRQHSPATGESPFPGGQQGGAAMVTIPQLGESFIDLIVNLAGRGQDTEFRQKLILEHIEHVKQVADIDILIRQLKKLLDDIIALGQNSVENETNDELINYINRKIEEILNELYSSIDDVNEIYLKISGENLNPRGGLFSISIAPRIELEQWMSIKRAAMLSILFIMMSMFLVMIGVFIRAAMISRK